MFAFIFSNSGIAGNISIFDFTEEEFKKLKVKKVKGETTWSLNTNEQW